MKELNLISVVFILTFAILTVEGRYHRSSFWHRRHGGSRPIHANDDDDREDLDDDYQWHKTDQSLSCEYFDDTGTRVFCHSGCCVDDGRLVCCGTSDETDKDTDHETKHVALFVILGLLAALLVLVMTAFVVLKLCKPKKTRTRRTTPLPDILLPVKPQQTRQKPPRSQMNKEPMNEVFTVTSVLPSYADVTTQIAESNRPPPEYSARETTLGSGYLRSFASPPPPYELNGLETTDSVPYSGNRST